MEKKNKLTYSNPEASHVGTHSCGPGKILSHYQNTGNMFSCNNIIL